MAHLEHHLDPGGHLLEHHLDPGGHLLEHRLDPEAHFLEDRPGHGGHLPDPSQCAGVCYFFCIFFGLLHVMYFIERILH